MPRLLLIAATTGYQTRSFAAAAARVGADVTLATDRCHILEDPWRDRAIPIRFEAPRESAELLAQAVRDLAIEGIAAVADRPTLIAALTAEKLGLSWHPAHAAAACRDKHKMRELFAEVGLPVPRSERIPIDCHPAAVSTRLLFPCVLKPLGLSGSRGVIRANNAIQFLQAFERIRRILAQPEIQRLHEDWNQAHIQVEQYIPGREFALEGLMTRGKLRTLAIFDKPDPLEGPFFEETLYVRPSRQPASVVRAISDTTRRAVHAVGLHHGPIHAEMRVNKGGVFMLEIAARPIGGLCARALRFRIPGKREITLEELIVLHALGAMPERLEPASAASGVMMIPVPREGVLESVSGVESAKAITGIDDVVITAKQGERLVPLPEGSSYPGFVFASGRNPAFVESALRRAHRELRFDIVSILPVIA
jgi:formate-dependent phosphoribosylglycinamide formyltransferase (GAR transformylase)